MKTWNTFIAAGLLVVGFGCRSNEPHRDSSTSTTTKQFTYTVASEERAPAFVAETAPEATTIQQFTTNDVTFTIQSIPNARLTPTSREGDKAAEVYSSNIIAVRVHTNNTSEVNRAKDSTNPPQENK